MMSLGLIAFVSVLRFLLAGMVCITGSIHHTQLWPQLNHTSSGDCLIYAYARYEFSKSFPFLLISYENYLRKITIVHKDSTFVYVERQAFVPSPPVNSFWSGIYSMGTTLRHRSLTTEANAFFGTDVTKPVFLSEINEKKIIAKGVGTHKLGNKAISCTWRAYEGRQTLIEDCNVFLIVWHSTSIPFDGTAKIVATHNNSLHVISLVEFQKNK